MHNRIIYLVTLITILAATACRKTEFATISNPAYLRVFNALDYTITIDNKDAPQPFLIMLIDPVLDEQGVPVGAEIEGDFLDKRDAWARPYPDAANTTVYQKEYPGSAKALAGPILNGYDLSSWAQVPSGKHRVMFLSRPISTVPFFTLDKNQRKQVLIDTTIDLTAGEVYTMQVLERDYTTKRSALNLRNENFIKQPFSDSLVYVNFYNLSAKGYYANAPKGNQRYDRVPDTTNVFYTLSRFTNTSTPNKPMEGQQGVPAGQMIRSQENNVTPYYSFPVFADTAADRIYTGRVAQQFIFLQQGYLPNKIGFIPYLPDGVYSTFGVGEFGTTFPNIDNVLTGDVRTGMIVTTRSGVYNPRSFGTINTIEYINQKFYLTTIQRKYAPPVY